MTKNSAPKNRQRARAHRDGVSYGQASTGRMPSGQMSPLRAPALAPSTLRSALRSIEPSAGAWATAVQVPREALVVPAVVADALRDCDVMVAHGAVQIEAHAGGPIIRASLTPDGAHADWAGLDEAWGEPDRSAADSWLRALLDLTRPASPGPLASIRQAVAATCDRQLGEMRAEPVPPGRDFDAMGRLPVEFTCPPLEGVPGWFDVALRPERAEEQPERIDFFWQPPGGPWMEDEWVASCIVKLKTASGEARVAQWSVAADAPPGTVRAAAAIARNEIRFDAAAEDAFAQAVRFMAGLPVDNPRRGRLPRPHAKAPADPMASPEAAVVQREPRDLRDDRDHGVHWHVPPKSALHAALDAPEATFIVLGNDSVEHADVATWIRQYGLTTSPLSTIRTQIEDETSGDFGEEPSVSLADGLQFVEGSLFGRRHNVGDYLPVLPPPPPTGKLRALCAVVTPTGIAPAEWRDDKERVQLFGIFDSVPGFVDAVRASGASTWSPSSIGARRQAPVGEPVLTAAHEPNVLYISTPDGRHPGIPLAQALREGVRQPRIAPPGLDEAHVEMEAAKARQAQYGGPPPEPLRRKRPDRRPRAVPTEGRAIDIRVGATSTTIPIETYPDVRAHGDEYRDLLNNAKVGINRLGEWVVNFGDGVGFITWAWDRNGEPVPTPHAPWGASDEQKRARALEWFDLVRGDLGQLCDAAVDESQRAVELTLGWRANNVPSALTPADQWNEGGAGSRPRSLDPAATLEDVTIEHSPLVAVPRWMGLELSFAPRPYCGQSGCLLDIDTDGYSGYTNRPIVAHLMDIHGRETLQLASGNPDVVKPIAQKLLRNYRIALKVGAHAEAMRVGQSLGISNSVE